MNVFARLRQAQDLSYTFLDWARENAVLLRCTAKFPGGDDGRFYFGGRADLRQRRGFTLNVLQLGVFV